MSDKKKKAARAGGFNTDGLCVSLVYKNDLPEPPYPPKFLSVRDLLPADRFVKYTQQTSLEKSHAPQLLVGPDVGVEIDLIDDLSYILDPKAELHPLDEALLADASAGSKRPGARGRPQIHSKVHIPWLRKTTYLSTENKGFGKAGGGGENKVLGRMINEDDDIMLEQTREEQLAAIDKTFTMAGQMSQIRHPVNPNLSIKSVQPLLPDFDNWGKDFCQGTFDVDPSSNQVGIWDGLSSTEQRAFVSQALLVDAESAGDEAVASLYLPNKDSFQQRKRRREAEDGAVQPGDKYDYIKVRDYLIKIQHKEDMTGGDIYAFATRDNEMHYVALDRTIRFTRRRVAKGEYSDNGKLKLIVEHKEVEDSSLQVKQGVFHLDFEDVEEEAEGQAEAEAEAEADGEAEDATKEDADGDADGNSNGDAAMGGDDDDE